MSESVRNRSIVAGRRSIGGAVRLKRSVSISTSNSPSDCDISVDSNDDDGKADVESVSCLAKRRQSVSIWEQSPKRATSKRSRSFLQIDPVVVTVPLDPTVVTAESDNTSCMDDNSSLSFGDSLYTRDLSSTAGRSSISSNNSRSSTEVSRELRSSKSEDKLLAAQKPWSLEDFCLGKALGKVSNCSKFYASLICSSCSIASMTHRTVLNHLSG